MKINKVKVGLLTLVLTMGTLDARVIGRGVSPSGTTSGSSSYQQGTASGSDSTQQGSDQIESCSKSDTGGYVGASFIRTLIDPSVKEEDQIRILETDDGVYNVEIGPHMNACLDLKIEVVKSGLNYFVRFKNNFEFTPENVKVNDGEVFENLPFDEKYARCLEGKDLLKNGEIDRVKAYQSGNTSGSIRKAEAFRLDVGDGSQSVSVFLGSAKGSAYDPLYPNGKVSPVPREWKCTTYENLGKKEKRLFTSRRDRVYDRALGLCEKENAEEILEELSRLKKSTAGNFTELISILENTYEEVKKERVKAIYERMDEIEEAMREDEDGEIPSKDYAEDYADEYLTLAKELSRIEIGPSTRKLNNLLEARRNADGREEKEKIDEQILEAKEDILAFSKRDVTSLSNMYDIMKEYNLVKQARGIEGTKLASFHFGHLDKKKEKTVKGIKRTRLDVAKLDIDREIDQFKKGQLEDWTATYELKRGNKRVLTSAQRRQQEEERRYQRLVKTLTERESKLYKDSCRTTFGFYRNQRKCQRYFQGRDARARRYQAQIDPRRRDVMRAQSRAFNYGRVYSDYLATREFDEPANYGGYSYYGADNYGMYYGDDDSYSGYDNSWQFQMGSPQMRGPAQQGFYAPGFNQSMAPQGFQQQGIPQQGFQQQGFNGPSFSPMSPMMMNPF